MSNATCELVWLRNLLKELKFEIGPIGLASENQSALYILSSSIFNERKKHTGVDCHFIREKIEDYLGQHQDFLNFT